MIGASSRTLGGGFDLGLQRHRGVEIGRGRCLRSCGARRRRDRAGSGMRGCGFFGSLRTLATGSATISSERRLLIDDAVDEGGVGAVLQQAPHQIGQQVLVAADRRIDAAGDAHRRPRDDLLVERLAHAVQALELAACRAPPLAAGHLDHRARAVRVVGGELRGRRLARRRAASSRAGDDRRRRSSPCG